MLHHQRHLILRAQRLTSPILTFKGYDLLLKAMSRPHFSPENRGPVINLVVWQSSVAIVLAVIVRTATKLAVSRKIDSDDYMIASALVDSFRSLQTILPPLTSETVAL